MERWIECRKCGHEYSSKLSKCPACSCITWNFNLIISLIIVVLIIVVVAVAIVTGFGDKSNSNTENSKVLSTVSISSKDDIATSTEDVKPTVTNSEKPETSSKITATASKKTESVSSKGNTSSKINQSQAVSSSNAYNFKVGTELVGDDYYITVPLNFLRAVYDNFGLESEGIKFEEFAYSLSDEDKAAGFTLAIKNVDGSATKMISYNRYGKFITDYAVETKKFVIETKRLEFIDDINHSNDFDAFGVVVNKNKKDLTASEYAQLLMLGMVGTEKQYYSVSSNNTCTVEIVYSNTEKEILKFPEALF